MSIYKKQANFNLIIILIISLAFIFSPSALAKTEVYFSLYDDPEAVIINNIATKEIGKYDGMAY